MAEDWHAAESKSAPSRRNSTPRQRTLGQWQDARDLNEHATEALEAARLMPPGREKTEALKKAGLLRNAANRQAKGMAPPATSRLKG
jgi:hypothetical protein